MLILIDISLLDFIFITKRSYHSRRREDVVCQRELPVDELLLFIVEGVAIVDVELALSSVLSDNSHLINYDSLPYHRLTFPPREWQL